MSRKIILFFILIITFSPRFFVFANFQINEIMYDLKTGSDDGREWVEIYNNNNFPVDLSSFRFFEADTNHKIKLIQGNANIPAQGYALIVSNPVKFKIDWPNFFGTIFDSSFSLNNNGEVLMLKDKNLNIVDQYTYQSSFGGAGDGNSLQKINQGGNTVWQGAPPTPGVENKLENKPLVISSLPISIVEKAENIPVAKKIVTKETTTPSLDSLETPILNQGGEDPSPPNIGGVPERGGGNYFSMIGLILLLGTCVGAVYFIRQKKNVAKLGGDFEILDE